MSALLMPRLGETVTEGTVIRWLKSEGESVAKDEMIVEISTDKVDSEIPAPSAGVVEKILIAEGEKVDVGVELARINEAGAGGADAPARGRGEGAIPATTQPIGPEKAAEPVSREPQGSGRKFLSPIVRKMAGENQVDLEAIEGTGRNGRISKRDINEYLSAREKGALPEAQVREGSRTGKPERVETAAVAGAREEVVPLSRMRKAIAEHMVRSVRTSAHVTAIVEVDMEKIVRLRAQAKAELMRRTGIKLTYLPFVCRALIEELSLRPTFNAVLSGDDLIIKHYINLGVAVSVDDGLIVPVVKDADGLNILGLARAIQDLAERARRGALIPDEVQGGTFTITNPGSYGSLIQTPIINQPQVGIVSLETIVERPVVVDSAIAIHHVTYLGLSYDHRVNDGAMAAQFLTGIKKRLEEADFHEELGLNDG